MSDTAISVRLDQWLWAARFYKTRPLAVSAIKNGRVTVNGQRAKPARNISSGEILEIRKQAELTFCVTVRSLSKRRLSAELAQELYEESEESKAQRAKLREKQHAARNLVHFPERRPDKRERRNLRAIKHHQE